MSVRNAQKHTLLIKTQIPNLKITCARNKSLIVIIRSVFKHIVVDIYVTRSPQKLHLIGIPHLFEH